MTGTGSITILLLGLLAVTCGGSGGTLESNDPGGIVGFHDFSGGTDKSFGLFVCASGGDVELQSVEAIGMEGQIEVLGAVVHEASTGFVGADDEFPPTVLAGTDYTEIDGAVVTTPCDEAAPEVQTQVVLGVSRTGPEGGTVEGVRVNYDGGSLSVTNYVIILCGDEMERCEDFAPEA